jgi:hypothetical protein
MEKLTREVQNYTIYCNNMAHTTSRIIEDRSVVSIPLPKIVKGIEVTDDD